MTQSTNSAQKNSLRILLLGKDGQVGWELQRSLSVLGEVVAVGRHSVEHCGDLANLTGLAETVRKIQPHVIVNAAAYTAVDKAESEPDLARTINALAPEVLAKEAAACGALLVHYSTDYVFDGGGDTPWREPSPTNPLNVYGATKLEGEQLIASHCQQYLIFRTSWVYAARGGNFAKTMLRLAKERDKLTVINDQFGAPTGADLLADITAHAIRQTLKVPDLAGLYHLVAAGKTTWYDYAKFVIEYAASLGVDIKVHLDAIEPVPTTAFVTPAKRPQNSRLDTHLLTTRFSLSLPHWQHGVRRMLDEVLADYQKGLK